MDSKFAGMDGDGDKSSFPCRSLLTNTSSKFYKNFMSPN